MGKKVIDVRPPCRKSRNAKQKSEARSSVPEEKGKGGRFTLPILILLLIGGAYLYYTSYRTEVVIYPTVEEFQEETELLVRATGSLAEDEIRGVVLTERISDSREFEAERTRMVEEKAEGVIEVCQEHSNGQVNYIAGTRFISDEGKYFQSPEAVVLPGLANSDGCADISVIAMSAGEDHNLPENSSFTLPGLVGTPNYAKVTGKSFTLTKEGYKREVPDIDEETKKNAEEQIMEDVMISAKEKIREEYGEEYFLESDTQFEISIVERGFEESEDESGVFTYEVGVRVSAVAVTYENITNFITSLLPENTTWRKDTEELRFDFSRISFEDEEADASVHFSADIYKDVDKEVWERELVGLSFDDAISLLEEDLAVDKVIVRNFPFGLRRVADNHQRVRVDLRFDKN